MEFEKIKRCVHLGVQKGDNFSMHSNLFTGKEIYFSSDYGGENNESKYLTYSFTFTTISYLQEWLSELKRLCQTKEYSDPPNYKDDLGNYFADPNKGSAKLRNWFDVTHKHFKGFVCTFVIDKEIPCLFSPSQEELHKNVMGNEHLLGCTYTPKVLEKACRVGAFAALVLSCILKDSLTCHWVSDNDSITKQPTKRDNADQQKYAGYLMKTLLEKNIDARTIVNLSYACPKSWGEDNFEIEAFLSLSDLFSGAIDEYYKIHHNDNFEGKILDYSKMKQKTADIISSQTGIPHYVYTLQRNINGKIGCARLGFIRTSN